MWRRSSLLSTSLHLNSLAARWHWGVNLIVMKFGGTSVGSAASIRKVAGIVQARASRKPFVVVSAASGVTDMLLAAARKARDRAAASKEIMIPIEARHFLIMDELGIPRRLIADELAELEHVLFGISLVRELTPRTLDYVASFGERISSRIVAAHMAGCGFKAQAFNAYDLGMLTDSNFGSAEILPSTSSLISGAVKSVPDGIFPVVTGFLGKTSEGEITTLSRGGSDYTAAIFGAALGAEEIQIWTDVDGVMTADPRVVPGAKTVDAVSFEEASELAYFGAKVLHPKTILPALDKDIPVRVLNTFNPSAAGTLIVKRIERKDDVTAITAKSNIFVINIHSARMLMAHGFLGRVFRLFDEFRVPVDAIATSEVNVSLTVEKKFDISGLVKKLEEFSTVTVLPDRASLSVVGEGIRSRHGVGGRIFSVLGKNGINVEMLSQSYGVVSESVVIQESQLSHAITALHDEFFGTVEGRQAAVAVEKGKVAV